MKVTERPLVLSMQPAHGGGRARPAGIHLTDLVRRLEAALPQNQGKRKPFDLLTAEEKAEMASRVEMGFVWEELVEEEVSRLYGKRIRKSSLAPVRRLQTYLQRDGIWMHPDVVLDPAQDKDHCILEECKATWKSMRRAENFESEMWGWHVQTQGYARALYLEHAEGPSPRPPTRRWPWPGIEIRVRYRVFWVNGDYRGAGPCAKEYLVDYSVRELHETWLMVLGERDRLLKEKEKEKGASDGGE